MDLLSHFLKLVFRIVKATGGRLESRPPFLIFGLVIRNNENRLIKEQISGINSLYLHISKYARVRDPVPKFFSWIGKAGTGGFSVDGKVGGELNY